MRKIIALTLAVIMIFVLALAGCDRSPASSEPTPEPTLDPASALAASETDTATTAQTHVPPASSTDTAAAAVNTEPAGYSAALGCVGKTVAELYAAAGQPIQDAVYTPSSQQEGAQDGTLVYDGFTVRTLVTVDGEFVQDVTLDQAAPAQDMAAADPNQAIVPADGTVLPEGAVPAA